MTNKSQACSPPTHVAVIGAGAAGLVAARELRREGLQVDVFEQQSDIGGVWVLDSGGPDGPDAGDRKVHTSMYDSLRVNLPRELMGFSDFPFVPDFMQGRSVDPRRFPHHTEVRQYLEAFADHFGVRDAVHLGTQVTDITPIQGFSTGTAGSRWRVRTTPTSGGRAAGSEAAPCEPSAREYDAVVICNGHYTVPRMPEMEGLERYPGKVEHSHLYRRPEAYSGKRVLIIGAFASGEDLAWEIARVAESVTISAKSWMLPHYADQTELFGERCNMLRRPWAAKMHADGVIEFEDGTTEGNFDVVMFCTGYEYALPFLEDGTVDVSGGYVSPLYEHLLHPRFGFSLSFVGLGFKNVPFPQCEVQSKYVAALLSGKAETPSQEAMEEWITNEARLMKENGTPGRHMHCMALTQFQYNDALSAKCGGSMTPAWRLALVKHTMELWGKYTAIQYRDEWEDEEALTDTYAAFNAMKQSTADH